MRLVEVSVVSKITYVTPFLHFKKDEELKIDSFVRRAYKYALGIPITALTERLETLELHNTISELTEAERLAQRERLSYSQASRHILGYLGINHP